MQVVSNIESGDSVYYVGGSYVLPEMYSVKQNEVFEVLGTKYENGRSKILVRLPVRGNLKWVQAKFFKVKPKEMNTFQIDQEAILKASKEFPESAQVLKSLFPTAFSGSLAINTAKPHTTSKLFADLCISLNLKPDALNLLYQSNDEEVNQKAITLSSDYKWQLIPGIGCCDVLIPRTK